MVDRGGVIEVGPMKTIKKHRILAVMTLWLILLGSFAIWFEMNTRREERQLALSTANAFFQQLVVSRQWNASHGGVYVPISETTQPNPYLPEHLRELTADNGMKLTKINPAYMTRQAAELAEQKEGGIRFHITSLKPIRPENKATDWEEKWLQSFEQGATEQGDFFKDGNISWFRYMAPLTVSKECLNCHAQQGYKEGDIRGGISISLPYPTHTHTQLFAGFGGVTVIGLCFIFTFVSLYEKKQRLLDATFNSPLPTCVTDTNHTILMANDSYWAEFGPLPAGKKTIKCYEHRFGESCHTELCPLTKVLAGASKYAYEPTKEKNGATKHFIVTAKPLLNAKDKIVGIVESFLEITGRKQLEEEKGLLIDELKKSLEQVQILSGFIPICASCKKIRDDQGFWSQVETYIGKHSGATFSHGICPDCIRKLYPELADEILAACSKQTPSGNG